MKSHIRNSDWDIVEKDIDQCAADSPDYAAWWHYALGQHYLFARKHAKGAACLEKTLSLQAASKYHPNPKPIKISLIECYIATNELQKAHALIDAASTEFPEDVSTWHNLKGAVYQSEGKVDKAIAELSQGYEHSTEAERKKAPHGEWDLASFRMRLAQCYLAIGESDKAMAAVDAMQKDNPTNAATLLITQARIYRDKGQYDKALPICKDVIARFPDSRWQVWDAHFYIAEYMYKQGKGNEAMAAIDDFYSKRPGRQSDYLMIRAKTLYLLGNDREKPVQLFKEFLAKYPNESFGSEVSGWLISCLVESEKTDAAADVIKSIAKTPPVWCEWDKVTVADMVAGIYAAKQPDKCIGLTEQLLKDYPKHAKAPTWAFRIAMCKLHQGDEKGARDGLKKLCEDYPASDCSAQARYYLVDYYLGIGDERQAGKALQEIASYYPDTLLAKTAQQRFSQIQNSLKDDAKPETSPAKDKKETALEKSAPGKP